MSMSTVARLRSCMILLASAVSLVACTSPRTVEGGDRAAPAWVTTTSGLQFAVVDTGTGPIARSGDDATIHETTHLLNGTLVFDSYAANSPVTFRVGGHQVIDGVDEAVTGMRVGGRRLLIVPPSLARRDVPCAECEPAARPLYAPTDTLRYDVLLVRVSTPASTERD